jgi:hypothetical protein
MLKLKTRAYRCNVMNVTSGDYVDVGGTWIKIVSNDAYGLPENPLPKTWSVVCEDGKTYGPAKTKRFARVSDLEDVP